MSHSDSEESEESVPAEEWKRESVLAEHLDAGETYQEIADQYEGATFDSVGYWVRKYDLTANHLRPKYTGNSVPLRLVTDTDVEHPLPEHYLEKYGIEDGDYARFTPVRRGVDLVVDMTVGDDVDGQYSSDRKLVRRQTRHLAVRYPRMLAHAIGLRDVARGPDAAGGGGGGGVLAEYEDDVAAEAYLKEYDEDTIRVEFSPSLTPWVPPTGRKTTDEVAGLTEKVKPLLPLFDSTVPADERGVDHIEKYRLDFPLSYIAAYDLEVGDEVVLHVGPAQSDEDKLALYVDFDGDTEDAPRSLVRRLQSYQNGTEDAPREQVCFYPGMTLLHCLGIGVGQVRPSVRLEPGPRHLAIVPL
jgi:hypothetical protein